MNDYVITSMTVEEYYVFTSHNVMFFLLEKEMAVPGGSLSDHTSSSMEPSYDMADMEDLLGSKLAEFLDTDYKYSLSQVPSGTRPHLYKGPGATGETIDQKPQESEPNVNIYTFQGVCCIALSISLSLSPSYTEEVPCLSSRPAKPFSKKVAPHSFKGGWCLTDYLTFDW